MALRENLQDTGAWLGAVSAGFHLQAWCFWAVRSRLAPFQKLAQTIRNHWEGLPAYFPHRITSAAIEPINVIIQTAWHTVKIRWRKIAETGVNGPDQGTVTLSVDDVAIFLDLPTGFYPSVSDGFAFNFGNVASTNAGEEGLADGLAVGFNLYSFNAHHVLVDDVLVRPLFTSPFDLNPMTIRRNPNVDPILGVFPLRWASAPGHNHRIEFSTDLVTWQTLQNRAGIDGFDFLTTIITFSTNPKGFDRVIRE